jgi:hypothetical protein
MPKSVLGAATARQSRDHASQLNDPAIDLGRVAGIDRPTAWVRRRRAAARVFVRVDRYAAWLSAILLFLFFVSGFGMDKPAFLSRLTGGLVTWRVSHTLHTLLDIPLMIVLALHTIGGIRRVLLRSGKRRRVHTVVAAGVGTAMFGFLLALLLGPAGF